MPESIPRRPFDQGLFLTHFNKGRELFKASASRRRSASWRRPTSCAPATSGCSTCSASSTPSGEAREGGGGLPQARHREPRGSHPALQPGPHLHEAGPPGGGGVRLPEGPGPQPRETPRSTSTSGRSTSGPTATRTPSTSTGRREPAAWWRGSKARWRPSVRTDASEFTAPGQGPRPRSVPTPRPPAPVAIPREVFDPHPEDEAPEPTPEDEAAIAPPKPVVPVSPSLMSESGAPVHRTRPLASRSSTTPSLPDDTAHRPPRPPLPTTPTRGARRSGGLPLHREGPDGGRLLRESVHQAGHHLLLQRQPHLLGQGEEGRRGFRPWSS